MKLTILRGLPASGKSTKAEELLRASGNAVRLNKDLLRTMLHCDKWSGTNEKRTRDAARALARHLLSDGLTVVIDDTNLNPGTLQGWRDIGEAFINATVEVIDVNTPLEECLRRDRAREKRVGDHVIIGMAMQYGLYPAPENGIVICDIDGTLADISRRRHFVAQKPKDWASFFAAMHHDSVRSDVLQVVLDHWKSGREVFLVSGRPETYRKATEEWLAANTRRLPYRALFMRPAHDGREDSIIKQEIYEKYFKDFDVVEVIDDRPQVIVKTWLPLLGKDRVRDVGSNSEFVEERKALGYWKDDQAAA